MKAIFVQVTVYDQSTGKVEGTDAKHIDSELAWEIESAFERIGRITAKRLDPHYYDGDSSEK